MAVVSLANGERRTRGPGFRCAAIAISTVTVGLRPAPADTLADAIVAAYESSPNLEAQRAQQQITDEGYVQARAGWRPTVSLQGTAGYSQAPQSDPLFGTQIVSSNSGSAALSIQQPVYTGGRTLEA